MTPAKKWMPKLAAWFSVRLTLNLWSWHRIVGGDVADCSSFGATCLPPLTDNDGPSSLSLSRSLSFGLNQEQWASPSSSRSISGALLLLWIDPRESSDRMTQDLNICANLICYHCCFAVHEWGEFSTMTRHKQPGMSWLIYCYNNW